MPPQIPTVHSRFSFETATVFALIATLVVSTLFFFPGMTLPFLPTKTFILAAGGFITLGLYILARLTRGNIILPPALLLGALWLPALAYLLSTLFSGIGASTAIFGSAFEPDTLGFMVIAAGLGTLAALALRRREHYRLFFKAGFFAGAILVLVQVVIVFLGQITATISTATILVGSMSDLAVLAGLLLVGILLALRLLPLSSRAYIVLYAVGAGALFLLAISNNSFVWTLLALISLGLFVESVMRRAPSAGNADLEGSSVLMEAGSPAEVGERSLVAPLVTLAVLFFFLVGGNIGNALSTALHISVLDVRPSWQSTLNVGKQVYHSSPFFGSGPSSFGGEWLTYRDVSLNQTVFWNLDFTSGIGFVPTSAITTGLFGLLAWVFLFVLLLFFAFRSVLMSVATDPFIRFAAITSFAATAYLFIVECGLNTGSILLALAFVFAGLFISTLRYAPGRAQWGVIFSKSPRLGFIIVFSLTLLLLASIIAAYLLVERYIAQVAITEASTALAAGDSARAVVAATRSLSFAPSFAAYQIQAAAAGAQLGVIANDQKLSATEAQQQFQKTLADGITAALAGTRIASDNYQAWITLGALYAAVAPLNVAGAYDNAKAAYDKAAVLNPTAPQIPYAIAQLEIAAKNTKNAKEALTKSITLKQDYTPAIFLLSQLEVSTGDIKNALAAAEAAAYFTPNDSKILFQLGVLRAAMGSVDGAIDALTGAVRADPQFANAHYFLAALYAKKADFDHSIAELMAISALSADNAKAVEPLVADLKNKKDPFPKNLLSVGSPDGAP